MLKRVGIVVVLAATVALGLSGDGARVQAGGGCHQIASGFTDAKAQTVSIEECKFAPAVIRIEAGDAIKWQNNDDLAHMVAGVAGSWGSADQYVQGDSVSYTFDETGIYPYFCEMHPGMVGAVVVGDGVVASTAAGEGGLAVSAVGPAAGAQLAASAQDDQGGDDFGVAAYVVVGLPIAVIGGAILLAGLRLSGRLPRA